MLLINLLHLTLKPKAVFLSSTFELNVLMLFIDILFPEKSLKLVKYS